MDVQCSVRRCFVKFSYGVVVLIILANVEPRAHMINYRDMLYATSPSCRAIRLHRHRDLYRPHI